MIRIRGWLAVGVLSLQSLSLFAEESVIPDPQWEVARAQFTSAIRDREPVDQLVVATPFIREVYFFTDLRNLEGRTVTHRWRYEGRVVSQVPFKVGGPRWRVNSKKEIDPDQVGDWSVTVVDESGWPLYTELFRYENGAPLILPVDAQAAAPVTSSETRETPMKVEKAPPQDDASQRGPDQLFTPPPSAAGSGVSE